MFVMDKLFIAAPKGKNSCYGNHLPAAKHLLYLIIYFCIFIEKINVYRK